MFRWWMMAMAMGRLAMGATTLGWYDIIDGGSGVVSSTTQLN
jgi:hypothetical protein